MSGKVALLQSRNIITPAHILTLPLCNFAMKNHIFLKHLLSLNLNLILIQFIQMGKSRLLYRHLQSNKDKRSSKQYRHLSHTDVRSL